MDDNWNSPFNDTTVLYWLNCFDSVLVSLFAIPAYRLISVRCNTAPRELGFSNDLQVNGTSKGSYEFMI